MTRKIGWVCTRGHANLDEERKCWGCAFRVRWLYKPVDWRRFRAYEVIKKNRRRARKPLYADALLWKGVAK